MTLLHSGTTSGRPDYLTEAVEVLKAAKRRPDSSVHRRSASYLALGNARLARIKRVKRQDKKKELDVALEAHRLAADAAGAPQNLGIRSSRRAWLTPRRP